MLAEHIPVSCYVDDQHIVKIPRWTRKGPNLFFKPCTDIIESLLYVVYMRKFVVIYLPVYAKENLTYSDGCLPSVKVPKLKVPTFLTSMVLTAYYTLLTVENRRYRSLYDHQKVSISVTSCTDAGYFRRCRYS